MPPGEKAAHALIRELPDDRSESLPKSVPSVAFSQPEQPVAVWLDGKVRKVALKQRPSGLLAIARLMAESQKNKQKVDFG
jgi:hypothetical protein